MPAQTFHTAVCLLSAGLLVGCGSDTTAPGPPVNNATAFFQLNLNHHAILMALTPPYDTLQLTATAISGTGAVIDDAGTTRYVVGTNDSFPDLRLHVDAAGVLHADSATNSSPSVVPVYAIRTIGNLTLKDTAFVKVVSVNPVPVLRTFTFAPASGGNPFFCTIDDDACLEWLGKQTTVTLTDSATGNSIDNALVHYSSADSTVARIDQGGTVWSRNRIAKTMVYAEATVFGRARRDSILFTVRPPAYQCVFVKPLTRAGAEEAIGVFDPGTVYVGQGGTIVWANRFTGHTADVVFDDPSAAQAADSTALDYPGSEDQFFLDGKFCDDPTVYGFGVIIPNDNASGSIPAWPAFVSDNGERGERARTFSTPGTYHYHSAKYGTVGTIVVMSAN